jgi:hypothetical protein
MIGDVMEWFLSLEIHNQLAFIVPTINACILLYIVIRLLRVPLVKTPKANCLMTDDPYCMLFQQPSPLCPKCKERVADLIKLKKQQGELNERQ